MVNQHANMVIVFADISGSTQLFDTYGNVRARAIETEILSIMMQTAKNHGGNIIKTIGDELMCTFLEPNSAIQAVCEMQKSIAQDYCNLSQVSVAIRIGLHYGEVLLEKNDVFGDAVNIAARMVNLAKANQIITTQTTIEKLSSVTPINTRSLGSVKVRGKPVEIAISEVIWPEDTSNITTMQQVIGDLTSMHSARLVLRYEDNTVELGAQNPTLSIGREEKNDLRVMANPVSRTHACVEFRKGKFILTDRSTNGTYIHTETGDSFFVHLEDFDLFGKGVISLGQKAIDHDSQKLIYYECKY